MRARFAPTPVPTLAVLVILAGAAWSSVTLGYDQYSVLKDATNCRKCHGDFRATGYVSKVDGQTWADSLHNTHRSSMLSSDCETCHFSSRFPALIGSSAGGTGLAAISCAGCHGRAQDGTGSGSHGYGAGLRQRHWRGGVTECVTCHGDSDPASKTVVGENVKPPYYENPGTSHPLIPTDPCNPSPAFTEDFAASSIGLDNDGDGLFDAADSNCAPPTPGEAAKTSAMLVTGYDKATGAVTVSYGAACAASDNHVEYGDLAALPTYAYTGQVCAIGNTGSATFTLPAGTFFLVVANDGTREGSYGVRRSGTTLSERPEDGTSLSCALPQALANRCDP